MTDPELRAIIRGIAPAIQKYVREHTEAALAAAIVGGIKAALAPYEKRIAALEARPGTKDAGVWRAGALYEAGDIVSHGGSGWICRSAHCSTGTEPNHDHFRLFVKAGRDARR